MALANIVQPLIDIFGPVLVFFHGIIGGSWGWSIIALTVVVRALLLPLAFKQIHSMQKLQRVAPQLKAIQAKYKDDKQRQRQELVKFYKEHEINPFASSLPLVAQVPVFIGLFYTLRTQLREDICPGLQTVYRHAYALHHHIPLKEAAGRTTACHGLGGSSWLFIHDLTNTTTGLTLPAAIRDLHHQLPHRVDPLLDHHQHVDNGPAVGDPPANWAARAGDAGRFNGPVGRPHCSAHTCDPQGGRLGRRTVSAAAWSAQTGGEAPRCSRGERTAAA